MAIVWSEGPRAGQTEYAGAVLDIGTRTIRVMSDVWEDERYATVWTGTQIKEPALSCWAYVRPDGTLTQEPETDAVIQTFHPSVAEVDATEEVRKTVRQWHERNNLIRDTIWQLRQAIEPTPHKEVQVFQGRKLRPGPDVYEVTAVINGTYGETVHLRNPRGEVFRWISIKNVRVVRPERYVRGQVACSGCRRLFTSAVEAGMVPNPWADGHCYYCRLAGVLLAQHDLALPQTAHRPQYNAFTPYPPLKGTGQGELLLRALFNDPEDTLGWLALADWLEEDGQEERAGHLRKALLGKPRVKARPIRKKDLQVSPWLRISPQGEVQRSWLEVYECVITGFPPQGEEDRAGYNAVAVRVTVRNGNLYPPTFSPRHLGQEDDPSLFHRHRIKGTLLRQCKAVLPPLEQATGQQP